MATDRTRTPAHRRRAGTKRHAAGTQRRAEVAVRLRPEAVRRALIANREAARARRRRVLAEGQRVFVAVGRAVRREQVRRRCGTGRHRIQLALVHRIRCWPRPSATLTILRSSPRCPPRPCLRIGHRPRAQGHRVVADHRLAATPQRHAVVCIGMTALPTATTPTRSKCFAAHRHRVTSGGIGASRPGCTDDATVCPAADRCHTAERHSHSPTATPALAANVSDCRSRHSTRSTAVAARCTLSAPRHCRTGRLCTPHVAARRHHPQPRCRPVLRSAGRVATRRHGTVLPANSVRSCPPRSYPKPLL